MGVTRVRGLEMQLWLGRTEPRGLGYDCHAAHCEISGRRAKRLPSLALSRPRLGRIHELDRKSEEKKNLRWRKRPGERASEDKREAGIIDPGVVNRAVVGSELSSLPSVFLPNARRQGLSQVACTLWKIFSWTFIERQCMAHFASKHPMSLYSF